MLLPANARGRAPREAAREPPPPVPLLHPRPYFLPHFPTAQLLCDINTPRSIPHLSLAPTSAWAAISSSTRSSTASLAASIRAVVPSTVLASTAVCLWRSRSWGPERAGHPGMSWAAAQALTLPTSQSMFSHLLFSPLRSLTSPSSLPNPRGGFYPALLAHLLPALSGTPVCTDLADLPGISSHSGVKRGAPRSVWLVGVGPRLKEAAGSSRSGESGSQVQGGLPRARGVSLGTGPTI